MRKLPFAMVLLAAPALAQVADTVSNGYGFVAPAGEFSGSAVNPAAVLWDNGPLVTDPGAGFGGADASALQTAIGGNIYGYGHQIFYNYWVADNFELTGASDLDSITFYCYQTGASTTSTITANNFELYDGQPGGGGSVIYSSMGSTLLSNMWSGIYRVLDTGLTASNRPIMEVVADASGAGSLGAGTYWVAWQHDGSLSSGPWAPPVTYKGLPGSGNALQSLDGGATWAPALDSGGLWNDDMPFVVEGGGGGPSLALGVSGNCPGSMTFTAKGATAGKIVAFAYGFAAGSTPVPPCPGLFVDIKGAKLGGTALADGSGVASLTTFVPSAGCGRALVQAVDITACVTSNVVTP